MNKSNLVTLQLSPVNTNTDNSRRRDDCHETWSVVLSGIRCDYVSILSGEMAGCQPVESPGETSECQNSQHFTSASCKTVSLAWEMDIEKVHPDQIGLPISGKFNALLQRLLWLGYTLEAQSQVSIGNSLHGTWTFVKEELNF